jgi:hypothetical protein
MTTKKKIDKTMQLNGVKLRISQGAVAKKAIHNIELLFRKMSLDPKAGKTNKRRLIGTMSVPTKLIEEVAALADQQGMIGGIDFNADKAREALAFAAAFEPVATKAEAFAQRVRDSIMAAKSDVGGGALAVYASLKGIVRRPEGAQFRDSFDKMTQIMKDRHNVTKRRVNKKVAAATAAAAAATPANAPPTQAPAKAIDKPTTNIVVNTPGGAA